MPAVVLLIFAAVPAHRDREPDPVKDAGRSVGEVQKRVVRRVEFVSARKSAFHRKGYPVTKHHPALFQVSCKMKSPLWEIVNKERAARFDHPDALI